MAHDLQPSEEFLSKEQPRWFEATSAFEPPTVIITLSGGLVTIDYKGEGCVLILQDYDACDPDQGEEELEERRTTCDVRTDEAGDEYQVTRWGAMAVVHNNVDDDSTEES